jgi:hypothetical protein
MNSKLSPSSSNENKKKKATLALPFAVSACIHGGIMLLLGGAILVPGFIPKAPFAGELVTPSALVDTVDEPTEFLMEDPGGSDMPTVDLPEIPMPATSMDQTFDVISTAVGPSTFSLPTGPSVISTINTPAVGAGGGLGGSGGGTGQGIGLGRASRTQFFGTAVETSRLIFVIDISGSMIIQPRSVETWQKLEDELKKSLEALSPETEFGMIAFAGDTELFRRQLVSATPGNAQAALNWIKRNSPVTVLPKGEKFATKSSPIFIGTKFAGTRADAALALAFSLKPDTIIFLSDGDPTFSSRAAEVKLKDGQPVKSEAAILQWVREQQKELETPVKIHTVAYLAEGGKKFMTTLARENQGTHRNVD